MFCVFRLCCFKSNSFAFHHIVPPSQRPPTNSLRIDRFIRPFTLKAVQELLGKSGNITSFWMDQIKTHCYVSVRLNSFFSVSLLVRFPFDVAVLMIHDSK